MTAAFTSPIALVQQKVNTHPNRVFLRQPKNRKLVDFTWQQTYDMAAKISAGLASLGLQPGDRVGILSKNCAEWIIADLAIMMGGFISVPIYPTANTETVRYVLEHSETKALFVGKLDQWSEQDAAIRGNIIRVGMSYDSMPHQYTWEQMQTRAEPTEPFIGSQEDTFSIVYTSGSTGNPKGAVISYGAFSWAGQGICDMASPESYQRCLSYLPLAHITERAFVESSSFVTGCQIYFTESLDTFVDDLKVAAPTFFISVPRLWSLFQQNILNKIGRTKLKWLLRTPIISGIVKRKIISELGLQHAVVLGCGSAPVSPSLIRWYASIGANISEAWGMTENCAFATSNHPFNPDKIGTVGQLLGDSQAKISEEGELLFKSSGLMTEYYLNPEATAEAFTEDGFFRTGDLATMDDDGFFSIIGRVKDNFKTAKGKYVSPVAIERQIAQDQFVELLCVIGSGLPAPVAMIQLSEGAARLPRAEIQASLERTIESTNAHSESHARIKLAVIVDQPWTTENGVLTPTLKIKRHELENRYNERLSNTAAKGIVWEDQL